MPIMDGVMKVGVYTLVGCYILWQCWWNVIIAIMSSSMSNNNNNSNSNNTEKEMMESSVYVNEQVMMMESIPDNLNSSCSTTPNQ
jgi:hypothetical protein